MGVLKGFLIPRVPYVLIFLSSTNIYQKYTILINSTNTFFLNFTVKTEKKQYFRKNKII